MELSETIKNSYAYADKNITIFETIELSHSLWGSSIKLVDSPNILIVTEGTFQPINMKISLPETGSGIRGQMEIILKFLSSEYRKLIFEAAQNSSYTTVEYRQYIEGDSDPQSDFPIVFTVNKVHFTNDETTINALFPDLTNIKVCRRVMNVTELPGMRT